jgi:hypothetical protein
MAQYRLLADHFVGGQYLEAGSVVSDVGAGAVLPPGWIPTLACDPIDNDGTQKFFNAGPTPAMFSAEHGALSTVLCAGRWAGKPVVGPSVYWEAVTVVMPPQIALGVGYTVKGFQLHGAEDLGFKSA